MTPEEVIEAGIENIQRYGHIKGNYGAREEGYCAMGAMRTATCLYEEYEAARRKLEYTIRASGYTPSAQHRFADADPIPRFNDDPLTSVEDVLLMMKKAANG